MSDTFYFVALKGSDESTLLVIDLALAVAYERDQWKVVDDEDFYDLDEAIAHARGLAARNGLKYQPFESRYESSLDEPKSRLK
ncbi:hypothetical protein V0M98_33485 (plasmid) [Pseudomonas silesiensis]|uniref:hypothetical protein n=1 Tax=Pseudomonas silesiensis TaxID=1853130 RepID=UPI0030CB1992